MVSDTIEAVAHAARAKSTLVEDSLARYLVLAMLAGAYVGLGIVLIFAIGAPLAASGSPFLKVVMGASFGIALTLVIFAGSELFTGNALVLDRWRVRRQREREAAGEPLGVVVPGQPGRLARAGLAGRATPARSAADPQRGFVESVAAGKMGLAFVAGRSRAASWPTGWSAWPSGARSERRATSRSSA